MPLAPFNNPTLEQTFLAKYCIENARCADRDPRGLIRPTTDGSAPPATGLVNPFGLSSFSLPTIERALAEMESSSMGAAPGNPRLGHGRRAGALTSHILGSAASPKQYEVQKNLFKSLLNHKDLAANG